MNTCDISRAYIRAAVAVLLAAFVGTMVLTGCGSAGQTYSPIAKTGTVAPAADFTIAVADTAPGSGTVAPGGTATYTVTLTAVNGFSSPVSLSVSGLPTGAEGTFSPNSVTPTAGGGASALSITTTAPGPGSLTGTIRSSSISITPSGTSTTFTVTGTGGFITHQATAILDVTQSTTTTAAGEN